MHWYRVDNSVTLPSVQGEDGQWNLGMVMEGAALADRTVFQDRLAEARRKGLPPPPAVEDGSIPEQQIHQQVLQERERSRELEQEKQQLQQELMAANIRAERAEQQIQQLQEQVSETTQNQ